MPYEEDEHLPLFHGIRSKKSAEQIEKEGFCSYGSPEEGKKNVIDALKYFGKDRLLYSQGKRADPIKIQLYGIMHREKRRNIYATTNESSPCTWWSKANPEHISLILNMAGVPPEQINKYLNEKFGNNCYNVELKTTAEHHDPNFNTHLNCIPPYLIKNVRKCKRCVYTGREDPE